MEPECNNKEIHHSHYLQTLKKNKEKRNKEEEISTLRKIRSLVIHVDVNSVNKILTFLDLLFQISKGYNSNNEI